MLAIEYPCRATIEESVHEEYNRPRVIFIGLLFREFDITYKLLALWPIVIICITYLMYVPYHVYHTECGARLRCSHLLIGYFTLIHNIILKEREGKARETQINKILEIIK